MEKTAYSRRKRVWDPEGIPRDVERRFLTTREVARYCAVPREEVLGWIDGGLLKASYIPFGHYRVAVPDFLAFVDKFGVQL